MSHRHRELPLVHIIRGRRDGRALRMRRERPGDYYNLEEPPKPVFRMTRRWRRHDQEMDQMLAGTSGRHPILHNADGN